MAPEEKKQHGPAWDWQQAMMEDYYDYRWHQVGDPLCDTFRRWKDGEASHQEVDKAIEEAYKQRCMIKNLFSQRPDRVVALIQWWDREWFDDWLEAHRLPPDTQPDAPIAEA